METHPWPAPEEDGTIISVRFPDGQVFEARWNFQAGAWQSVRRGKWVPMKEVHGANSPVVWRKEEAK